MEPVPKAFIILLSEGW